MDGPTIPRALGVVRGLSVATPREEIIGGKPVRTSIVREPVDGPIVFAQSGPCNNQTAVHTEHVLAFASEHYDYWTGVLGVPRASWPWAFWGENITLDGLDEASLCIGDVIRIGTLALQVTGPRTPCFKLSWRLGQTQEFLGRLIASGRVGVYMRVIAPGKITVGDVATLEPRGRTTVTVAQVARMIDHLPLSALPDASNLVKMRELGVTTRTLIGYKINLLQDTLRCREHRWPGWRSFRISDMRREGRDVVSVTLVPHDDQPIAPFRAGQHVAVKVPGSPTGLPPVIRSWSLSAFAPYPHCYRITVKRESGPGSLWINDTARVGDQIELRAPSGRFVLDRSNFCRVVLVSAGVGMTPLLAMLRAHNQRGADAPAIHWLHSAADTASLLHADEVDQLLRETRLATRQVHLTAPSKDDDPAAFDRIGRITAEHLAEILSSSFPAADSDVVEPGEYSQFYVCGPRAFTAMITAALADLGVEQDQIFTEAFAKTDGARVKQLRPAPASIRLARSGLTLEWSPDEDLTILEMVENAGIDAPFSCRVGTCGTCEVTILAGQVHHEPAQSLSLGNSHCLPCCARPASDTVTLDL